MVQHFTISCFEVFNIFFSKLNNCLYVKCSILLQKWEKCSKTVLNQVNHIKSFVHGESGSIQKFWDVTPAEGFNQVYLPNSNRLMDDIILIYNSHLGGGIESEKLWFQILVMNLGSQSNLLDMTGKICHFCNLQFRIGSLPNLPIEFSFYSFYKLLSKYQQENQFARAGSCNLPKLVQFISKKVMFRM